MAKDSKCFMPREQCFPFHDIQQSDMFLIPVTKHYALQNFWDCAFNKNAIKEWVCIDSHRKLGSTRKKYLSLEVKINIFLLFQHPWMLIESNKRWTWRLSKTTLCMSHFVTSRLSWWVIKLIKLEFNFVFLSFFPCYIVCF